MAYPISASQVHRRPWGGLASFVDLHREMNRVFDDLFFNGGALMNPFAFAQGAAAPLLDVQDRDDEVCIHADMPGVAPQDLDLRIEGDMLTLCGERKQEQSGQDHPMMERSSASFRRAVRLPFEPDPARIRADFENGVVTVHVPREAERQRSRRIEVHEVHEAGGQGQSPSGRSAEPARPQPQQQAQPAQSDGEAVAESSSPASAAAGDETVSDETPSQAQSGMRPRPTARRA